VPDANVRSSAQVAHSGPSALGQLFWLRHGAVFLAATSAVREITTGHSIYDPAIYDPAFAELLRIKAEILLRRGQVAAAEDSFHQAIKVAQAQEALFWELRALRLARLRVTQGRGGEARQPLAQIYDCFTEGFQTPDLRTAKAFLDELAG
jgi:predicted negative regulator of RcsB-dependent stress response